jgi:tetratricopeptide (TPR) repeat protein
MKLLQRLRALGRAIRATIMPREAGDYLARGLDRHLRGDLAGAIADYDQAITRSSDSEDKAIAHLTRGNARKDQGDLVGAIDDYDQALAYHPSYAGTYLSRGQAHRELGDRDRAITDFRMVRELTTHPRWCQEAEEQLRELLGQLAEER